MHFKVAPLLVPSATHTQRLGGHPEALLRKSFFPFKGLPAPIFKEGSRMEQNVTPIAAWHWLFSVLPRHGCNVTVTLWSPQLAQILPTEENFLLCFRQHVGSSTEFMEVRPRRCLLSCTLGPAFLSHSETGPPYACNGLSKIPNPFWVAELLKAWSVGQEHQCYH